MNYETWYNNLSIKDKAQEKKNLETIVEDNNFSKTVKQIAQKKLNNISTLH